LWTPDEFGDGTILGCPPSEVFVGGE